MTYLQFFIISTSGGLIYNKNLSTIAPTLSINDCLRLGSTFHGLHAIASQIAPTESKGIEKIESDTIRLHCFQSLTGVKFVVTATQGTADLDVLLQGTYELYADYVLKNPFYEMEMPIRCELFNKYLDKLITRMVAVDKKKKQSSY